MIEEYFIPMAKYYMTGRFLIAYWYIPFIMAMFFMSPLHIKYIGLSIRTQVLIILAASVVSLFSHRPVGNINVLHSVVYFTPIYLIGITSSINKELIYRMLHGKEIILFSLVAFLAVFQAYIGHSGNYHKPFFDAGGIDLMYLQKLALCFFFMIWLARFEKVNNRVVHAVASTSFTVFFIHPFVLGVLGKLNISFIKLDSWLFLLAFTFILIAVCIVIAKTLKKLIPKYSRYLIGY